MSVKSKPATGFHAAGSKISEIMQALLPRPATFVQPSVPAPQVPRALTEQAAGRAVPFATVDLRAGAPTARSDGPSAAAPAERASVAPFVVRRRAPRASMSRSPGGTGRGKEATMSEFVFLYRNGEKMSPETMQKQMGKWSAWLKELGEKGVLKNAGQPLDRSGKLVSGSARTVTDGLFAEAKDIIGGYSIVEAKNIDHAVELARGCPIFDVGGAVEVRPTMAM